MDGELGEVVDTAEDSLAIQRDLNRMEKLTEKNLTKFNNEKCKALYLGQNNPVYLYVLGASR